MHMMTTYRSSLLKHVFPVAMHVSIAKAHVVKNGKCKDCTQYLYFLLDKNQKNQQKNVLSRLPLYFTGVIKTRFFEGNNST